MTKTMEETTHIVIREGVYTKADDKWIREDEKQRKSVIYVAGAYRAPDPNGVWENIMHARSVARKLWMAGWAVICPHTNTIFMDGNDIDGEATFLEGDLEIIRRLVPSKGDALMLLNNWEGSVGARGEKAEAEARGLIILFEEGICQPAKK